MGDPEQADLRYCPRCAGELEARPAGDAGLPHPTCVACGYVLWQNRRPCVDALIVRGEGAATEALFGRQSDGGWDLPGNFLNATDLIEPALQRECRREMGVEVDVGELLCACEDTYIGIAIVTLVYRCTIRSGEPRAADLIDEVRWFPLGAPPEQVPVAAERAVAELRRRIGP
ncbi:MAG: NUDIX domain-containing protein [Dehalococcoidia bacterium]